MSYKLTYLANARFPTEKAHGYQICKMCEAFALAGAEVTLVHPYRHNPGLEDISVFDYYGIKPVFRVHTLRNWDVVRLNHWIPDRWFTPFFFVHGLLWSLYAVQKVAKERADLYYTREATIAYWLVRLGLPTIYEAHVVPNRAQRWLLKGIASATSLKLVIVLTSFIKERLIHHIGMPAEKILVLPDAVDLSLFENLPEKEECRRKLAFFLDRFIIGYIGRFRTMEMEKGLPDLIRTMKDLPSVNGRELLVLCVGGPMDAVPAYLDLARRISVPEHRLKFVDRVPNTEVPYWIRACDVVTIPWQWTEFSAYFTSPLKLFEYMAAGAPVVATDLPSIRDILRHGENAWLVAPGDPRALAEGIRYLLEHPDFAQSLANQAKRDVQQFTWKRRAEAILQAVVGSSPVERVRI